MDCIECGACDYVCPSHIPLVSIYKDSKAAIETRLTNHERSKVWQQRFQYHQSRIKKEKDQAPTRTKAVPAKKPAAESEVSASNNGNEQEFFSKEKASREIAAAVARVKARRDESKKAASVQDKSK
jgi:electron transport complex protein RnfC